MNIFKIFSVSLVFIIFLNAVNFYGQDVCTNYTVSPGTTISSSGSGIVYNTTINVPASYIITDANVTVSISHTWNADLDIYLISPSGTSIELSSDNGGNGDNYNNVTFDDASANTLPSGNTTLSGTYRPEGSLAGLNGENSSGNWTLRVIDDASGDGGTINNITINLCYTPIPVAGYLGPGGVGNATNNVLWLKGDGGTFTNAGITQATNGQQVYQWNDASGNNRHAIQTTSANRPLYESVSENGMPGLKFTGDLFIDGPSLGIAGTSSYTYLMVFKDIASTSGAMNDGAGDFILDRTSASNELISLKPITGNVYGYQKRNNSGSGLGGPLSTTAINTNTKIVEMRRNYNVDYKFLYNGNQESVLADSDGATTPPNPRIGRHATTSGGGLKGFINEFIIYNFALNTAQSIIVSNYLSAKYDKTLASNDLYTQDINTPARGNFDHHVAGIGQASDGSNHTDSQGAGIVRINNPSALSNNEFLFWGEETKNPIYNFTTNSINYTKQLNSKWRVSRVGNIGTVDVSFDISTMNLTGRQACMPLQLVIDNSVDMASPLRVYDLTIVGNIASATGVTLGNNNYFTLRYIDQIVWNGTSFFNGAGLGSAPNNTNSCLKFKVKAGTNITLTSDAYVREVEVEAGATLNIANGILLQTDNGILNNGTIDLLGEAQLIQRHTGTTQNSGTGNLKIRQQGTTNVFNYNYWSAPVNRGGNWQIGYLENATKTVNFSSALDGSVTPTTITLSTRWLYGFKGAQNNYNAWAPLTTTSNIAPGVGYTLKGSGAATPDQEFIFRGTPNDGTYSFPVAANTEFLVGNPYPSALDANKFIDDNLTLIDGSLYFWESFASNNSHYLADYEGGYATYNKMMPMAAIADTSGLTSGSGTASRPLPTRYVPVGQGFFTTITNPGTLTFDNTQRAFARESLNQSVYYKTAAKSKATVNEDNRPKIWFAFTQPKGYTKFLGLGYDTSTTYGYDKGYDAKLYDNFKNDVFWLMDNTPLVIQALPEINTNDQLPLGTKIADAGIYTFAINNMENVPDDLPIYLRDNLTNIYYNLRNASAQLVLNKQTTSNQFSIVFKEQGILATTPLEGNTIGASYSPSSKTLAVHTTQPVNTTEAFYIYNTIGQLVLTVKAPSTTSINLSHIPNGVYILKINSKASKNLKSIKFVKY